MTAPTQHIGLAAERRTLTSTLALLRAASPRVQCLTNTVAQAITANCLHALGVRASMATHAEEIVDMSTSADALLINLGTIDQARIDGIEALLADERLATKPTVLDPVFVQHSGLRMRIAERVLQARRPIVKGNSDEMAALRAVIARYRPSAVVTTGHVDVITCPERHPVEVLHGHPQMACVTGLGCALGAVIAAFAVVESAPQAACLAALQTFGLAGERAAQRGKAGPGTIAVAFIDELAALETELEIVT